MVKPNTIIALSSSIIALISVIIGPFLARKSSKEQIKESEAESKRQYEIAIRSMSAPLIQDWINQFADYYSIYDSLVASILLPQNTLNKSIKLEFTNVIAQLEIRLDPQNDIQKDFIRCLYDIRIYLEERAVLILEIKKSILQNHYKVPEDVIEDIDDDDYNCINPINGKTEADKKVSDHIKKSISENGDIGKEACERFSRKEKISGKMKKRIEKNEEKLNSLYPFKTRILANKIIRVERSRVIITHAHY